MFEKHNLIVIGAGFYGSVIAEQASRAGHRVAVIERRKHIGGNCYTEDDAGTGINVHRYGPHIFHTSNEVVWKYINQFTEFNDYRHKCRIQVGQRQYSMPINLDTINSWYGGPSRSPEQAQVLLASRRRKFAEPANFEQQALNLIGPELYQAFIHGYTTKQWETDPKELPASYARRLPVRTNYSDRYYNDTWEGIPKEGYTPIFRRMLTNPNIELFMDMDWNRVRHLRTDQIVVYTGAIDRYFDYRLGRLTWRTLDFDWQTHPVQDYQGITQVNYGDIEVPWTRIIEHRHFHPERDYPRDRTVISVEYSREAMGEDTPYYPVNSPSDQKLLAEYRALAQEETGVVFGGRLGEYLYLDMHQVISSALSGWKNKIEPKLKR